MAGGLFALLDDIAALAKIAAASVDDIAAGAAKAGTKTIGVIVDDAAVTPQYVAGLSPKRELPIIWKITKGSLRNKLLFILPAILLLSQYLPAALPILLILGGTYLAFEGAEKILHARKGPEDKKAPALVRGSEAEKSIVSAATRTDFILSLEIMVIALAEVADSSLWERAAVLFVVAILITALVYGVVAILVKMDDVGLALTRKDSSLMDKVGQFLLKAMPAIMRLLGVVGTFAMLWVGGHILIAQADALGLHQPLDLLHKASAPVAEISGMGGVLAWLVDAGLAAVFGLVWGMIVVGILHLMPFGKHDDDEPTLEQLSVVVEHEGADQVSPSEQGVPVIRPRK